MTQSYSATLFCTTISFSVCCMGSSDARNTRPYSSPNAARASGVFMSSRFRKYISNIDRVNVSVIVILDDAMAAVLLAISGFIVVYFESDERHSCVVGTGTPVAISVCSLPPSVVNTFAREPCTSKRAETDVATIMSPKQPAAAILSVFPSMASVYSLLQNSRNRHTTTIRRHPRNIESKRSRAKYYFHISGDLWLKMYPVQPWIPGLFESMVAIAQCFHKPRG